MIFEKLMANYSRVITKEACEMNAWFILSEVTNSL